MCILKYNSLSIKNRKLRGEEIHGLNIEELQLLEKTLEIGLSRVIEKKVSI